DVVRTGVGRPAAAELNAVATRSRRSPGSDANVADDHVMHAVVVTRNDALDRNPGARRCLTGDRDIGLRDAYVPANDSTDVEDDNPGTIRGARFRQATWTGRIDSRHLHHSAAAPAHAGSSPTLSPWKRLECNCTRVGFCCTAGSRFARAERE